jgi:hypothetical protein
MTFETVNYRRRLAGKAAALCCLLFFLSAVDGMISRFGQSAGELRLLPGESTPVNGSASEGVREPQDLKYASDSDLIRLSFEKIHTGFWLGGLMWRGELTTSADIKTGEYTVAVSSRNDPPGKPLTVFRVRIFGSAASLQEASASIIQRYTGVLPWWSAALFFPLAIVFSGIVYLCSQRREQLLRQEGRAEIYRIGRKDDEYEVSFALGTKQGVRAGSVLKLLDKAGVPVGSVTVKDVYEEDATAVVTADCVPEPGFIVALS